MVFLPTDLIGVTLKTTKRPVFNTVVVEGDGGTSRRNAIQSGRVSWYFKLNYEFVYKQPQGVDELFSFFASMGGAFATFLYRDPTDNLITSDLGTFLPNIADGTTTTQYQLARYTTLTTSFIEMLTDGAWSQPFGTDTFQPYVNGVPINQPNYTIHPLGGISFGSGVAPAGSFLSWSGNFYFPVCFKTAKGAGLSGDKFMNNYWAHTTVELQSSLRGTLPASVAPPSGQVLIDSVLNVDTGA